jgi:hypothetical protein
MKKIYILLMAIMPVILWAQPTITNMESMPVGTSFTEQLDSALGINSGAFGANRTWNYVSVIPTTQQTGVSINPATAPYIDSFPGANEVLYSTGGLYSYLNSTAGADYMMGIYDTAGGGIFIYYQNTEQQGVRPVSYGNSGSDPFARHYTIAGYKTDGSGNLTWNAESWGTITTPVATYPNCLRIKVYQLDKDTFLLSQIITTTETYTWLWFDGVHSAPVFSVDSIITSTGTHMAARHLLTETAGINELSSSKTNAMVFPNPSNGTFVLAYHLSSPNAEFEIKDIAGRTVWTKTLSSLSMNENIDVSNLPQGIYLWTITSDNEITKTGKINIVK